MVKKSEVLALVDGLCALTENQFEWVRAFVHQFQIDHHYSRHPSSDLISAGVLNDLGDLLRIHHAMSRQPLSKAPFEYALERVLKRAGQDAAINTNPTYPGHDLTINGIAVSLKTEAAKGIKERVLHISKWMEMGKGDWNPPLIQLPRYLEHLTGYARIFTLRCLLRAGDNYCYELVEIPKSLLLEASLSGMRAAAKTKQQTTPYYCDVIDSEGQRKFALYFDAGTERKLQVRDLRKDLCTVHATWAFASTPLQ